MNNLTKHTNTLLDVMECHPMFLASVQGECEMIESTYQSIKTKVTNWDKNVELLNWLKSGEGKQSHLQAVLQILRTVEEGQEHVANLIDGTNGPIPLPDNTRQVIKKVKVKVAQNMTTTAMFMAELCGREVIVSRHEVELNTVKIHSTRNLELIEVVHRRSEKAFEAFLDVLMKDNQKHVVDIFKTDQESILTLHVKTVKIPDDITDESIFEDLDDSRLEDLNGIGYECSGIFESESIHYLTDQESIPTLHVDCQMIVKDPDHVETVKNPDHITDESISKKLNEMGAALNCRQADSEFSVIVKPEFLNFLHYLEKFGLEFFGSSLGNSICIYIRCKDLNSLYKLEELSKSGELRSQVEEVINRVIEPTCPITIDATLDKNELRKCRAGFLCKVQYETDLTVANQTQDVVHAFFHYQLKADGLSVPVSSNKFSIRVGLTGYSTRVDEDKLHVRDSKLDTVGRMICEAGDRLDHDQTFQHHVSKLSTNNPEESFAGVATELFRDGVYTWGRIIMLFSFGYKLFKKCMETSNDGIVDVSKLLLRLMNVVVQFIKNNIAAWITSHGGWTEILFQTEILNGIGATNRQIAFVCVAAVITLGFVYFHMRQ